MWQDLPDKLTVRQHLTNILPDIDHLCGLCRQTDETVDHLLVQCPMAQRIRGLFPCSIRTPTSSQSFSQWLWTTVSMNHRHIGA